MIKHIFLSTLLIAVLFLTGCNGCSEDKNKSCEPGTAGCECLDDGTCNDGFSCVNNVCEGETFAAFSVKNKDARSCDVLVLEKGESTEVKAVVTTESATAKMLRHDPKVSVSFISASDASFIDGSVSLSIIGFSSKDDLEIEKTECFDKDGKALSSSDVTLVF
ncbi:MAG: hypothetical protein JXR91_07090 [Deltaproteobacteria bacterium]|nr:hypothetical protein [Deltaproteobacteria bacterium]